MNALEQYVADVFDFDSNQDPASFEERSGPPEELSAVIGLTALNFQRLEDELSQRIVQMLGAREALGEAVVSELSFRVKLNIFSACYFQLRDSHKFNWLPNYEDEYFRELMKALVRCETLRNQILHSTIVKNWKTDEITRTKAKARIRGGFVVDNRKVDIPYLYNVADYIIAMMMEVEEFFIGFGPCEEP